MALRLRFASAGSRNTAFPWRNSGLARAKPLPFPHFPQHHPPQPPTGDQREGSAMCDEFNHAGVVDPGFVDDPRVSRRTFGLLTAALAGVASVAHAQSKVVEKD